jgi:hypothetical protein
LSFHAQPVRLTTALRLGGIGNLNVIHTSSGPSNGASMSLVIASAAALCTALRQSA